MPWLWSWIGFAFVMLTAVAGMTGTGRTAPVVPPTATASAAVADGSAAPTVTRGNEPRPSCEHELDGLEPEIDEDGPTDALVAAVTMAPAWAPSPASAVPDRTQVGTGRSSETLALARGPPTAAG